MIPQRPLLRLVERDPKFAHAVASTIAERHLALLAEFEASVQQRGLQRLASYLESLADADGAYGVRVVRLPASKTVVASRLGVTKETLSRLLRELADRRTIAVARTEVTILDRDALATVALGGLRPGTAAALPCAPIPALAY